MKYFLLLLIASVLMLGGCYQKDSSDFYIAPFEIQFNAVVKQGGKDVTNQYKHAYGVGNDSLIAIKERYRWYYYYGGDSFLLPLPLNAQADTVMFCLVRKNNSIDTVGLSYWRKFTANSTFGYRFTPENPKIFYLSSGFLPDSCLLNSSSTGRSYYGYYDNMNTNIRLMLKP